MRREGGRRPGRKKVPFERLLIRQSGIDQNFRSLARDLNEPYISEWGHTRAAILKGFADTYGHLPYATHAVSFLKEEMRTFKAFDAGWDSVFGKSAVSNS